MNKEFIPYEEALALEELGMTYTLDSPVYMFYDNDTKKLDKLGALPAPLWQQALRWFRENHNLISSVDCLHYGCELKMNRFIYKIVEKTGTGTHDVYDTYEEAELACLNKLIKFAIKNKIQK